MEKTLKYCKKTKKLLFLTKIGDKIIAIIRSPVKSRTKKFNILDLIG